MLPLPASQPPATVCPTPVLTIKGTRYAAQSFLGCDGTEVVRLSKLAGAGEVYDVSRGGDGLVRCTCPAYIYKIEGSLGCCKHGTACVEAGLILMAAPVPTAEYVAGVRADGFGCDDAEYGPSSEDDAWASGFALGLDGLGADPDSGLSEFCRLAFLDGLDKGHRELEQDRLAFADDFDRYLDEHVGRYEEAECSEVGIAWPHESERIVPAGAYTAAELERKGR